MQAAQRSRSIVVALACLSVGALLFTGPEAEAKKNKSVRVEREISQEYSSPAGALLVSVDLSVCVQGQSCMTFVPEASEKYVSFSAKDQTGTPAPIRVEINGGAQVFCGDTGNSLFLNRAAKVNVSALAVALPNCSGIATAGAVTATFSNLP